MKETRPCPLCGKEIPHVGFLGHVSGAHKLNAAKFIEQYPDEPPLIMNPRKVVQQEKLDAAEGSNELENDVLDGMTLEEIKWFKVKVEEIFNEIDRDLTLKPRIVALVSDFILSMRYNKQLLKANSKPNSDGKSTINKDLNQAIKELESRIDTKMRSLGIDRQSKVANRQQSRSTPSTLISAYLDEIQRQPDEVLETLRIEEDKALAEVRAVLEKMYFPNAADIEPTHLGKEDDSGRPAYVPPSIDDIIQRAGVEL